MCSSKNLKSNTVRPGVLQPWHLKISDFVKFKPAMNPVGELALKELDQYTFKALKFVYSCYVSREMSDFLN